MRTLELDDLFKAAIREDYTPALVQASALLWGEKQDGVMVKWFVYKRITELQARDAFEERER